jgi:hypothetical protein
MTKLTLTNRCTSFAGHSNGHAGVWEQCHAHCAACQGLHPKPLETAIRQLLALYCPGSSQGPMQITMKKKYTYFAGHFNDHGNASVWYRMNCPMEEVHGFPRSHWMLPSKKHMLQWHQFVMLTPFFQVFLWSTCWKGAQGKRMVQNNNSLWHIKMMRNA